MSYEVSQRVLIPRAVNNRAPAQGLGFTGRLGVSFNSNVVFGLSDFTFSAIINSSSISPSTYTYIFGGLNGCLSIAFNTNGVRFIKVNVEEAGVANYNFLPNRSYHITVTRSSLTRKTYVNGLLIDSVNDPRNYNGITKILNSYNYVGDLPTLCSIHSPLIYNRGLSEDEVQYIYDNIAPQELDYNNATGSPAICTSFSIYFGGGGTLSSVTSTGFNLSYSTGNIPYVAGDYTLKSGLGNKFRLSFSLTRNSGDSVSVIQMPSDGEGQAIEQLSGLNPAYGVETSYTFELSSNVYIYDPKFFFVPTNGAAANFSINNFSVYPLGVVFAPEANQLGAGLKWYDTSGNLASVDLSEGEIYWIIPFSGNISSNSNLNLRAANNFNLNLIPSGTGDVEVWQTTLSAPTAFRGLAIRDTIANRVLTLGLASAYNWIQSSGPLVINLTNNVLIGGSIDNGFKLEVTGTTRFSGDSTFNGKLNTLASSAVCAGLNIPHGSAPTSPINGDMWTTTTGLYIRINNATVGPLGTGSGSGVTSVFGRTGAVVAVSTDYSSVGITNTAIGATNPSTGVFTTLSTNGTLTAGNVETASFSVTFTNAAANRATDIRFPNTYINGLIEIEVTSGYNNQNSVGVVKKIFSVGANPNNGIWNTAVTRIVEAHGAAADNWTIGDFAWDATNSCYIIPVYHIVSTGNMAAINIRYFSLTTSSYPVLPTTVMSAEYTATIPAAYQTRHYVYYNDRLGIGTSAPSTMFQVASTGTGNFRLDTNGSGGHYYQGESNARLGIGRDLVTSAGHITFTTGGGPVATTGAAITMPATNQIALYTSNGANLLERLRIDGSGNVGIGTTTPSSILDASLSSGATSGFRFKGYSDASTSYLLSLGTQTYPDIFQIKSVNGLVTMGVVGAIGATPDLVIQTNSTERIRILSGGNVGIANNSPSEALDIGTNSTGKNVKINSTLNSELIPALTAGNWTGTNWSATGTTITHTTGTLGSISPVSAISITAGKVYKVVMTLTAGGGSYVNFSLGGKSYNISTAATQTWYVYAINTNNLSIGNLSNADATTTISSVSIKEVVASTGMLTVEGPVTFNSTLAINNLGIGTPSSWTINAPLEVIDYGANAIRVTRQGVPSQYLAIHTGGGGQFTISAWAFGNDKAFVISTDATNQGIQFHTGLTPSQKFEIAGSGKIFTSPSAYSVASWTTAGSLFEFRSTTVTNNSTAASGTVASAVFYSFAPPTLAATNASVTTTAAATVYIGGGVTAGANQTLTNSYGLWNVGNTRLDGNVGVGIASASAKLHVYGDSFKFEDTSSTSSIRIGPMANTYPYLRFDSYISDNTGYFWGFGQKTSAGATRVNAFFYDNNRGLFSADQLSVVTWNSNEYNGSYPSFSTFVKLSASGDSWFNGGNVGLGTTTIDSRLTLKSAGDYATFYNNSDVKRLTITNAGELSFNTSFTLGLVWGTASLRFAGQFEGVQIIPYSTTYVGFSIKGNASQTESLQYWKDSAGTVLSRVNADGAIQIGAKIGSGVSVYSFSGYKFGIEGGSARIIGPEITAASQTSNALDILLGSNGGWGDATSKITFTARDRGNDVNSGTIAFIGINKTSAMNVVGSGELIFGTAAALSSTSAERMRIDKDGTVIIHSNTASSSTITGALRVVGGIGVGGSINAGQKFRIDPSATFTGDGTYLFESANTLASANNLSVMRLIRIAPTMSGNIAANLSGYFFFPTDGTTAASKIKGAEINMTLVSNASVIELRGVDINVPNLNVNAYSIYSLGAAPSYFNGNLFVGNATATSYGTSGKIQSWGTIRAVAATEVSNVYTRLHTFSPLDFRHIHYDILANTANEVSQRWVKEINGTDSTMMELWDTKFLSVSGGIINTYTTPASGIVGSRIVNPAGASYATTTASITGAWKITLPASRFKSNTMIMMTVRIYQYSTGKSLTFRIGGYNYSDLAGSWFNTFAQQDSDIQQNAFNIRFGNDGLSNCIWIGETNSTWDYPQVFVTDVQVGFSSSDSGWSYGWTIAPVTAFDTIFYTRTASVSINTNNITTYGVSTIAGTANQVLVNGGTSAASGAITLSLPQSIGTTSTPTFAGLNSSGTIFSNTAGGATGTTTAFWGKSGNASTYFGNNQIVFSYDQGVGYPNAIKSRHNAGAASGNAIDFYVWNYGVDATNTIGTKHVMSLNGGNVGIGTTGPSVKLQIYGADERISISTSTDSSSITIGQWDGVTNRIESSTRKLLITSYNAGISMGFAGAENFHISTSGNVGVGTTIPNATLQIAGTSNSILTVGTLTNDWGGVVAIGITNGNGVILSKVNTANDSNRVLTFMRNDTLGATITGYKPNGTSSDVGFFIGANTNSYLNGGYLGIGTTNPTYKFEISGTAGTSGVARIGSIDYSTTTVLSVAPGVINFDAPGIVGGRLKIDSNGNVGIGSLSPTEKLEVIAVSGTYNGAVALQTDIGGGIMIKGNAAPHRIALFLVGSDNIGSAIAGAREDSGATWKTNLTFYTNDGVSNSNVRNVQEKMRITSAGKVGINTSSPDSFLHVKTITAQTTIDDANQILTIENAAATDASGNLGGIRFRQINATNAANAFIGLSSTGNSATRANLVFASPNTSGNTTTRMTIDSSGNVGIGASPSARLHVSGGRTYLSSSDGYELAFARSGAYFYFYNDNGGSTGKLSLTDTVGAGNEIITFTQDTRRVGIGTTSPSVKFHVVGSSILASNTSINPFSYTNSIVAGAISDGQWGVSSAIGGCGSTGHGWAIGTNNSRLYLAYGNGATVNTLQSYIEVDTTRNMYLVPISGNVGIGTSTAPAYKLEVNGSFAATTKSFVISHPTKQGKKLRYASLEGPENGVYIRGKTTSKIIELPDYWTKLVDPESITVQLTPIGANQKLYVEKIEDNKVYIGNENVIAENINYFFYILAERVDVDKLQVEIDA